MRAGMARTFQVTNVFPRLTVEENVSVPVLAHAGQALQPWRRLDAMEGRPRSASCSEPGGPRAPPRRAAALSHGDRRLLDRAAEPASEPRMLLLDEPAAGMGAGERDRVLDQVCAMAARGGLTILLVEHDMGWCWVRQPDRGSAPGQGGGGRRAPGNQGRRARAGDLSRGCQCRSRGGEVRGPGGGSAAPGRSTSTPATASRTSCSRLYRGARRDRRVPGGTAWERPPRCAASPG